MPFIDESVHWYIASINHHESQCLAMFIPQASAYEVGGVH